jgi:hypothetical protein
LDRIGDQLAPQDDPFERMTRRRESKAVRRRVSAGLLGIGVTVALIVGMIAWGPAGSRPPSHMVGSAGAGVPLVAGPGEYYYVDYSTYQVGGQGRVDRSGRGALWVGPDDSGRMVMDAPGSSGDHRYAAGSFPGQILSDLSQAPDRIVQQLIERGSATGVSPNPIATTSPGRSQETTSLLRTLEDLLSLGSDTFLTPEQIRAIFEGAQTIPDVTTATGVTDPLGRGATRLSFIVDYNQGGGSEVDWYFDPGTGQFMGEVWVDRASGAVQLATLIDEAGIAASMDGVPVGDALYVQPGSDRPSFVPGG